MPQDESGEKIPIIQAPATVLPPPPATPQAEVRAVIKQDADIDERAKKAQGQRDISDVWENTQKRVALSVTYAALTVASLLSISGTIYTIVTGVENERLSDVAISAFVFLSGVANLVIGFYFGRTNHTKVGGTEGRDAS